ncbi:MAG: RloB family protein [Muribaculaceae bacterium]|nr:RloB family protein [Muribaculaceae bacterium]
MKRSERKKRPFKQGSGIAVIGEGPTEQYYLLSIQGLLPVNVFPKVVKEGMDYLIARVEECIAEGYDKIYCLIDMDNKSGQKAKADYTNFLRQYSGKQFKNRQSRGYTEVIVIENHPCLEIWFYYYFRLTTGLYSSYEGVNPLKPALRRFLSEYEKRIEFFKKCGGLHQYIVSKGGSIDTAIHNSELSVTYHSDNGEGAFSKMCRLLEIR